MRAAWVSGAPRPAGPPAAGVLRGRRGGLIAVRFHRPSVLPDAGSGLVERKQDRPIEHGHGLLSRPVAPARALWADR